MSIDIAAKAVVEGMPGKGRDVWATMVAIMGAESGYNLRAAGDDLAIFTPADQNRYRPYACNGKLSHGLGQVFVGVHHAMLSEMSGISETDGCGLAEWLYDPVNNVRACAAIYANSNGFTPWSTFNGNQYAPYLSKAYVAVDALLGVPPVAPKLPMVVSFAELGDMRFLRFSDGTEWVLLLKNPRFENGALTFDVVPRE